MADVLKVESLVRRLEETLRRQRIAVSETEAQLEVARIMADNARNPPKK